MLELIGNVLKTIEISVQWLEMKVDNENDIMNILPHLTVDYIRINSKSLLNLSNLAKLDQWRKAAELEVKGCTIMNSIQELNLHNFQKITITVNSISTNDFIFLKEIATKSVADIYFNIYFNHSSIDDSLYTSLPLYDRIAGIKCTWYFPTSNPEKFLEIIFYYVSELVRFAPIHRHSVPDYILNRLI
uniref:FTH domain-containing protein n=1 Tax=Caenorhabditis tropicalis TaxID=1561998 RepID=A0A1I7UDZ5_9PELO